MWTARGFFSVFSPDQRISMASLRLPFRPSRTPVRIVFGGVAVALLMTAIGTGPAHAATSLSGGWRAQHTLAGSQCWPFTGGAQAPYAPNGTGTAWSKQSMSSNCLVWTSYGIGSNGLGTVISVGDQNFRARWTGGGSAPSQNSQAFSGSLNTYADIAANGTNWAAVGNIGRIRYSANDGVSFSAASTPGGVPALEFVSQHHGTWITGGGNARLLWRSTDNGRRWSDVSVSPAIQSTMIFQGATYDSASATWIAVGSYGEIWKSTNDGATWSIAYHLVSNDFFTDVDASTDGTIIASTASWGRMGKSTNGGASWTFFNIGGIALPAWNAIKAGPTGEWIVAGLANRVYFSLDNGVNWAPASGLPSTRTWNDLTHASVAD